MRRFTGTRSPPTIASLPLSGSRAARSPNLCADSWIGSVIAIAIAEFSIRALGSLRPFASISWRVLARADRASRTFGALGARPLPATRIDVAEMLAARGASQSDSRAGEIDIGLFQHMLAECRSQLTGWDFLDAAFTQNIKFERSERDADQPVDLEAERAEHVAHFAVLAFADTDGEPGVGALFAVDRRLDRAVAHALDRDAVLAAVERRLS